MARRPRPWLRKGRGWFVSIDGRQLPLGDDKASNRPMTDFVSIPGLITFNATFRRIGCSCSATNTTPMPPSPICSRSWYLPIVDPPPQ